MQLSTHDSQFTWWFASSLHPPLTQQLRGQHQCKWLAPLHDLHIDSLHFITWSGSDTACSTLHDGSPHCYIHHYDSVTQGGLDTAYSTSHDGLPHHYIHNYHSITQHGSDTAYSTLHDGLPHHYIHHYHSITQGGLGTAYSTSHDDSHHHYIHHYHLGTQGGLGTAYSTLLFVNTNTRMKDVVQDSPDEPLPLLTIWQQLGKQICLILMCIDI